MVEFCEYTSHKYILFFCLMVQYGLSEHELCPHCCKMELLKASRKWNIKLNWEVDCYTNVIHFCKKCWYHVWSSLNFYEFHGIDEKRERGEISLNAWIHEEWFVEFVVLSQVEISTPFIWCYTDFPFLLWTLLGKFYLQFEVSKTTCLLISNLSASVKVQCLVNSWASRRLPFLSPCKFICGTVMFH